MLTAPTGFIDALRWGSSLVKTRLTVYQHGNPTTYVVPVSTCDITVDRSAANRRTGSITVELVPTVPPAPEMPVSLDSALAPFGNEIFIELSMDTAGGDNWVPVGLFDIATAQVTDSAADVTVTLGVYDRSWVIAQRHFVNPYNVPAAGGNFADEIVALLNQVWGASPPLTFNIVPTTATVPTASYNQGTDPWQTALDMAAAAGYELFFDTNGTVVGRPIPDPRQQPAVWVFGPDTVSASGLLAPSPIGNTPFTTPTGMVSTMTRDQIFNHVIVTGTGTQNAAGSASGSTAPVTGSASDSNPNSSTYVSGPMGDIPEFVQTPLATTTAVAQAMATNDLAAALSNAWTLQVSAPLHPLFEVDDVIAIYNPRLGLNGTRMVIDQIQFGVRYDALTVLTGRVIA